MPLGKVEYIVDCFVLSSLEKPPSSQPCKFQHKNNSKRYKKPQNSAKSAYKNEFFSSKPAKLSAPTSVIFTST